MFRGMPTVVNTFQIFFLNEIVADSIRCIWLYISVDYPKLYPMFFRLYIRRGPIYLLWQEVSRIYSMSCGGVQYRTVSHICRYIHYGSTPDCILCIYDVSFPAISQAFWVYYLWQYPRLYPSFDGLFTLAVSQTVSHTLSVY